MGLHWLHFTSLIRCYGKEAAFSFLHSHLPVVNTNANESSVVMHVVNLITMHEFRKHKVTVNVHICLGMKVSGRLSSTSASSLFNCAL